MALIVLPLLFLYTCFAIVPVARLFRKAHRTKSKSRFVCAGFVAAVAILIPWGDVILGKAYFTFLCETQAKEEIYKRVTNVSGVLAEGLLREPTSVLRTDDRHTGYDFLEAATKKYDAVSRSQKFPFARVEWSTSKHAFERTGISEPAARYSFGWWKHQDAFGRIFHIESFLFRVRDLESNDVLAEFTRFIWRGGWIEHLVVDAPAPVPQVCFVRGKVSDAIDVLDDQRRLISEIVVPMQSLPESANE